MIAAKVRATALYAVAFTCLATSVVYAQSGLWVVGLVVATGAPVCVDTALHLITAARRQGHAVRPPYDALDTACCETWWTSLGTDHDTRRCTHRKDR
ncbi:hypothetical protein ACIBJC_15155 [Streptomyces sp. NPDC050509]|uniref:hypothetical protein n=1 Tax=Streptomyces sp. NPDC050509 TaxID=3365620 RepID=UPI0037883B0A